MNRVLSRLRSLLRGVFRRAELDAEMNEEFRFHIERRTEDLVRSGMSAPEARRRARLEFGSTERYRQEAVEARGLRHFDELRSDARYFLRTLARDRPFSLSVILTLAICIGANVAVYGVVESVVLRPLPFPQPDRLVTMYNSYPGAGLPRLGNSVPNFFFRRERVTGLENVALYVGSGENVSTGESVERVPGLRVTPSFFPTLGIEAAIGRTFLEEEMEPGREPTVLLTHGYWQEHFGGSADILDKTLEIDGRKRTIVGVLPETFRLPTHPDARLVHPLSFGPSARSLAGWHVNNNYFMLGRLAPGATVEQVEAEIAALNASLAHEWRGAEGVRLLANVGFHTVVVDAQDDLVRNIRAVLFLLWGAVVFVLLIGCVNIANLMLARSEARLPELATRVALGAGRARLARQILTEAAVMGVLGGVFGIGLAAICLRLLTGVGVENLPRGAEVGLHTSALLYAVALALGASIISGVMPVLSLVRRDLGSALQRQSRGATGNRLAALLRGGLATAQVCLAFLLLVGAGLMLRSFQAALDVDPGFEPEGVLTAQTALTAVSYPDGDARRRFYQEWLREVRAVPGVVAAGVTTQLPFGPGDGSGAIAPEGYQGPPGESPVAPRLTIAGPGYFEAMGIEVLEGRTFEESDGPERPAVIVIDEWLARRYWPDRSPLGNRMTRSGNFYTVIGVVETIKHEGLTAAASDHVGAYYFTYRQFPTDDMSLVVRTAAPDVPLAASIRSALDRVDPDIPLFDVRPLEERISASLGSRRMAVLLLILFGSVALFLAGVGTYGVLAYAVAQRRREIGIRMALGSQPVSIVALVLKQGLLPTAVGLAIGGIGAFFLVRLIQSLIFGVRPMDPLVLAGTAALMALAAAMACLIPARRATRVDPITALSQ